MNDLKKSDLKMSSLHILFRRRKAVGVLLMKNGHVRKIFAKKEVILSAGVFNTPQLLMLSGIGPHDELQKFRIPVTADLPVGLCLEDHVTVPAFFSSEGNLSITPQKNADPANQLNYLLNKEGLNVAFQLAQTSAFQSINATFNTFPTDCDLHGIERFHILCFIRRFSLTNYYQTSTCRMGSALDPTAVVDPFLRVKGVEGLRVVDASIMRHVPRGNTNAPTIMIAEKAADIIRQSATSDHKNPNRPY